MKVQRNALCTLNYIYTLSYASVRRTFSREQMSDAYSHSLHASERRTFSQEQMSGAYSHSLHQLWWIYELWLSNHGYCP